MTAVADYLSLPPIQVFEVATFYSMFETKPVGRHSISVCTNISCMLRGGEEILAHVEKKLGIKAGQSTADGKFYLKQEEECLAACCGAPMMMVDHVYHENLTPAKVGPGSRRGEGLALVAERQFNLVCFETLKFDARAVALENYRKIGGYRGLAESAQRRAEPRRDHRRGQEVGPARPRRRGFPDRA